MIIEISNGLLDFFLSSWTLCIKFLIVCHVLGSIYVEFIFYDETEQLRFNSTNKVATNTEYAMKWMDNFNKKT